MSVNYYQNPGDYEIRAVTQELQQMMLSPTCKVSDAAKFLFMNLQRNNALTFQVIEKSYANLFHNSLVDSSRMLPQQIFSEYQNLSRYGIQETTSTNKSNESDPDIKYEKMMTIQILSSEVGTVLDKIKKAAIYLHKRNIPLSEAEKIILQGAHQLQQNFVIKRANLPPDEAILNSVNQAYENPQSYAANESLQPKLDHALSIQQTLPIQQLKTHPWFLENRPDLVVMEKFDGVVTVLNPKKIKVSVPNPQKVTDYLGQEDAKSRTPKDKAESAPDYYAPMLLAEEWAARHFYPQGGTVSPENIPGNLLVMNCGWFNVFPKGEGTLESKERINPHVATGSFPLGPLVIEDEILADHTLGDKGQPLDAITFRNGKAAIYTSEEMAANPGLYRPKKTDRSLFTINGFKILSNGNYIETPPNNNPNSQMPRSGIGIKEDGSLVFCVVSTGENKDGITAKEFADFFKSKNCISAINLDNSGSAAMSIVGRQEIIDKRSAGIKTTSGGDMVFDENGTPRKGRKNRPIPLALVISSKPPKYKPLDDSTPLRGYGLDEDLIPRRTHSESSASRANSTDPSQDEDLIPRRTHSESSASHASGKGPSW